MCTLVCEVDADSTFVAKLWHQLFEDDAVVALPTLGFCDRPPLVSLAYVKLMGSSCFAVLTKACRCFCRLLIIVSANTLCEIDFLASFLSLTIEHLV